jgi:hypothetical protein
MTRFTVSVSIALNQCCFIFFHPSVRLALDCTASFERVLLKEYLHNLDCWKEEILSSSGDRATTAYDDSRQTVLKYFRQSLQHDQVHTESILRTYAKNLSEWARNALVNSGTTLDALQESIYQVLSFANWGSKTSQSSKTDDAESNDSAISSADARNLEKEAESSMSLPEERQPDLLVNLELREFQRQALWWMTVNISSLS